MRYPVLEIQSSGFYLSSERGFIKVVKNDDESKIPIDDIESIIFSGPGNSISTNLIRKCSEAGVSILVCDKKYHPVMVFWPAHNHHLQSQRLRAQVAVSRPLKKQIWKEIVKEKISNQREVLRRFSAEADFLEKLVSEVKSGDSENAEAQAARFYWKKLFGADFRRDPMGAGPNPLLNFGYAIVRGTMAREISATGLHPAFGLHHHSQENPFCLVDDLMEPFRPVVDIICKELYDEDPDHSSLLPESKKRLIESLSFEVSIGNRKTDLRLAMRSLARSLANTYLETKLSLNFFTL